MDNSKPKCESCRHFDPGETIQDSTAGRCRRRAPVVSFNALGVDHRAWWPVTYDDDWCSEHELREPPADRSQECRTCGQAFYSPVPNLGFCSIECWKKQGSPNPDPAGAYCDSCGGLGVLRCATTGEPYRCHCNPEPQDPETCNACPPKPRTILAGKTWVCAYCGSEGKITKEMLVPKGFCGSCGETTDRCACSADGRRWRT